MQALGEEIDLVRAALPEFDREAFNAGHLTPVYFGSAIKGIGVADLLDGLAEYGPPPRAQPADKRVVEATEPGLTALVFKIQANMDPNHRDRIAFARVCSGRLVRGMRLKQVRTGKQIPLHAPQFFFAREREIADEAFAGDVVGIPNHGTLRIGDTLTEGEDINFTGVPYFAPEILRRVRLDDAMKAKKLRQALVELAEEGVVQLFRPQDGAAPLVGVVGVLQLDVLQARLAGGIRRRDRVRGVALCAGPLDFVADDRAALAKFMDENRSAIGDDVDGDPVFLATSAFMMRRAEELAPELTFRDIKDVHKAASRAGRRSRSGGLKSAWSISHRDLATGLAADPRLKKVRDNTLIPSWPALCLALSGRTAPPIRPRFPRAFGSLCVDGQHKAAQGRPYRYLLAQVRSDEAIPCMQASSASSHRAGDCVVASLLPMTRGVRVVARGLILHSPRIACQPMHDLVVRHQRNLSDADEQPGFHHPDHAGQRVSSAGASAMGPKPQSRIRLPPSVRKGFPPRRP